MDRYICIHGHFYQPPRENPWLEAVEIQDSAAPYHDWNERITAECYATNASSRLLDEKGRITSIESNYARISFDIGPTLLSWLEKHAPAIYEAILAADRQSMAWRSGHGSAMAQGYNHMILPLANSRDKATQIEWGVKDFAHRFRRDPEGMWLPEAAVDLESLDMMASLGIKYTVLAPHQARRIRHMDSGHWSDVGGAKIDPARAYVVHLPSGRSMSVFFYDGPISRAVAFEGLLKSGEIFSERLLNGFSDKRRHAQLMHIATDGESYGHHHRFGDMALAYALSHIEKKRLARLTNYGEFLAMHPPEYVAEILENTSWSCAHGVERWRSDCGCNTGSNPAWRQTWRTPLREALDTLRDNAAAGFEEDGAEYFKDPWAARNAYISVILDRSGDSVREFMKAHAVEELTEEATMNAVALLEIQRNALLMYTSCAWFFDDITGIEALQILKYAARAIQLSEKVMKREMEKSFLEILSKARSNNPEKGTAADIYRRDVKPFIVNHETVAAHFAISSLFEDYPDEVKVYCYEINNQRYFRLQSGKTDLLSGICSIRSEVTGKVEELFYAVLRLGHHDFNCGVKRVTDKTACLAASGQLAEAFEGGSFADIVRLLDRHFGTGHFTLHDLFKDEQRRILTTLIEETMVAFEHSYRAMYEENRILMGFLKDTGMPPGREFMTAAWYTLNLDMNRLLTSNPDAEAIQAILDEMKRWEIDVDKVNLEFAFRRTLEREMQSLLTNPTDLPALLNMNSLMDVALKLPFDLNLWMMQNTYRTLARSTYGTIKSSASPENEHALWIEAFRELGRKLNFNLDAVLHEGAGR